MHLINVRLCALSAAATLLALLSFLGHATPAYAQSDSGQLAAAELRAVLEGLGYAPKDLNSTPGKEKYEFVITKGGLDIPVAAEISASKSYIWLTVFLKDNVSDSALPAERLHAFLKRNSKIQPSQFYITESERLMCAIALDNRDVTSAVIRRNADKLTADVADSKALWE